MDKTEINDKKREELKKWFQRAKKCKCVHALYKTDNTFRNTPGFYDGGFFRFILKTNLTRDENIRTFFNHFRAKTTKCSLKETMGINYWGDKVHKLKNINDYDYD
jgi:hypothetical protein